MQLVPRSFSTIVLYLFVAVVACSAEPVASGRSAPSPHPADGGVAPSPDAGEPPVGTGPLFDSMPPVPTELIIEPATLTIPVVEWNALPQQLTASFRYADGSTAPAPSPEFSIDLPEIASVDAQGLVTPTGDRGGAVVVTASDQGLSGTATVNIEMQWTLDTLNLGPAEEQQLRDAVTPDVETAWAYPYDGTVFPQGLAAPTMMWDGGTAGDSYRVHISGAFVNLELFTAAPPPARLEVDDAVWEALTASSGGDTLSVTVSRLASGSASLVADHSWTIANARLRGMVYYWATNIGRVLRIKPGADAPDDFLAAAGHHGCSTCHTVSANGSTMVIGGEIAPSSYDLRNDQPMVQNKGHSWAMPALSGDGTVLVPNNAPLPGAPGGDTGAFDTHSGAPLPATGLENKRLWMPAFSPDDEMLAYIDEQTRDLRAYDWNHAGKTASNDRLLVAAQASASSVIAFPTLSPDHQVAVYQRGDNPTFDTRVGEGNLHLVSTASPGTEIPLSNLNGTSYPFLAGDRDRSLNFEPVFAPLPAGGYYWVVFTSRRTYGNLLTGSPHSVKQLWVAAIDLSHTGSDPSKPAFWLPGQNPTDLNMRGFWALEPCRDDGAECEHGSECCGGTCVADTDGTRTCGEPPEDECVDLGSQCETTSDCCDVESGIECRAGVCTWKGPA